MNLKRGKGFTSEDHCPLVLRIQHGWPDKSLWIPENTLMTDVNLDFFKPYPVHWLALLWFHVSWHPVSG